MTQSDPTPFDIEAQVRAELGGLASGAWFSPVTVTELLRVIDSERHGRRTALAALATPPPSLHTHTPIHKMGDTNAYCSTCGFFPLPLHGAALSTSPEPTYTVLERLDKGSDGNPPRVRRAALEGAPHDPE